MGPATHAVGAMRRELSPSIAPLSVDADSRGRMRRLLLLALLAAACAPSSGAAPATASPSTAPAPVEVVGPGVLSTAANEYNPSLSPDGRTLVFARSEADFRNPRIFFSRLRDGRWSAPEPAPFTASLPGTDPTFSPDGQTLYFASDRPAARRDSTRRDLDLWRVRRRGDGWGEPEHLGDEVNSRGQELGPAWYDGWLYFGSTRGGRARMLDIYRARDEGGRFGAAEEMPQWNTEASEGDPEFSRDGRVFLFWSDRAGGRGAADLYVSHRTETGWTEPVRVEVANSAGFDFTPSFSPDGRWLLFASTRAGPADPAASADGQASLYRVRAAASLP